MTIGNQKCGAVGAGGGGAAAFPQDTEGLDELEFELGSFLRPLGLEEFTQRFAECGCSRVRDVMAFTDGDLRNLGVADASRRKLLLHRLSSM